MGCVPSKIIHSRSPSDMLPKMHLNTQDGFYFHTEKDAYIKARALEAIKKCDILLFQQVLQQYQVRPSELISTLDERKTLVHMLATYNFSQGMAIVLDHLFKTAPTEMMQILNSRDSLGNTCLALCCQHEAVQTLDVLLKFDMIDPAIKNNAGKTAYDIALDNMSGCVKPLSLYLTSPAKALSPQKVLSSPIVSQSTQLGSAAKGEHYALESQETPLTFTESDGTKKDVFSIRLEQIQLDSNTRLFQLINELSQSQKKEFIDDEFPHDNLSIVPDEQFLEYFEGSVAFTWVKPEAFMNASPENIKLFDKIDVNDVSKSPIAGCEIYSVLAALTEFPQRLLRIFTTNDISKFETCSVNFLVCGVPVEILLDPYFPCNMETKTLAFSTPKENELWFSYLEKAVAKLFGDYSNIDNLSLADGFELLTGMPSAKFNLKQMTEDELWNCLSDFYQRNYLVCVGSSLFQTNARNKNFSFVNVSKVNETKIVKLRSHYGDDSWRWKHAERMKKWSKEFKEKIGFFEHEKDCFYIELKELIDQFDFLTVCYYQDTWERQRVDIRSEYKKEVFFEINVMKQTEIIISLHQKLPYFVEEGPEYGISPVEIMLVQDCGANKYNLISCGGEEAFVGRPTVHASDRVRIQLEQGKYIVRTKVYWVDGEDHDFSFSTFSSNPVEIKVHEDEEDDPFPDFLEKVFIGTAEKSKEKFKFSHDCYFVSAWAGPYLWVCGLNNGDKNWNLDIIFEKKTNLKIGKKYRNSEEDIVKFKVPAKGRNIAWAKRLTVGEVGLKWRFEQSWE